MPGLSGLELQHELKKRDAAVPVILITGHGDIAMAVKAIKDGAFDFIEKPFDDERLIDSIAPRSSGAARDASSTASAHCSKRAPRNFRRVSSK